MGKSNLEKLRYGLIFILIVFLDQLTKIFFDSKVLNNGISFGLGDQFPWVIITAIVLVTTLNLFLSEKGIVKIGLLLVISGGFANLLDRIIFGAVRDFIWWSILNVYGNIADIFVSVGVMLVLVGYWLLARQEKSKV